jgi:hypothetical protein
MAYSTDEDLTDMRPKIMEYGVENWSNQRTEAEEIIHRALDIGWYRPEAQHLGVNWRDYPFDADLLLNGSTQLKRLSCLKTLELAYLYLMKDSPKEDAFERQRKLFKDEYTIELRNVLAEGVDYDWDDSGVLNYTENQRVTRRRLKRC